MLSNFLIGLREGLEASLVVGILVAYLVRSGRRERLPAVWTGVVAAVAVSLGFGALLQLTSTELGHEREELFAGLLSIAAVGFVTWMIFWMRRTARFLATELRGRVDAAVAMGTGALVTTAFLAVGREGLETSLFLWTAAQATGRTAAPLAGAALGLVSAAALGWAVYRQAVRINLATFFRWTGAALVVIAAGVLAYGVHDLQEAGVLPVLNQLAFDVSGAVPPSSWYGSLLKGALNFSPKPSWLQVVVWVGYLVPVMTLFLWPARPASPAVAPAAAGPGAVAAAGPGAVSERAARG